MHEVNFGPEHGKQEIEECEEFKRSSEAKCCLCARGYKARDYFIQCCVRRDSLPKRNAPDLAASQDLDLPLVPRARLGQGPHPNYPMLGQLFSPSCFCPSYSDVASGTCLKFLSRALIIAWDSPALPAWSMATTSKQSHSCPPTGKVNPSNKYARKAAAFNLQIGHQQSQVSGAQGWCRCFLLSARDLCRNWNTVPYFGGVIFFFPFILNYQSK